jgi:uridine kinase
MARQQVVTIGVAGGTASGKSTISAAILEQVGAENMVHILHDSYYRSWYTLVNDGNHRHTINFDHPDSLETDLMIEHLRQLQRWKSADVPVYDFVVDERSKETVRVDPRPVILVEGILVLDDPALRELFDIKIFVDAPADLRFIRRLRRDIADRGRTLDSVIERYMTTVRPMHEAFVEPSKRFADVIVPQGGRNEVAVSMIADRLRWILHVRDGVETTE